MKELTDCQLIKGYQENNHSSVYYNEAYRRYRFFIKKHSGRLNKKFQNSSYMDFEDYEQSIKLALLELLNSINVDNVKDKKKYKLAISLLYKISNIEKNISNNFENKFYLKSSQDEYSYCRINYYSDIAIKYYNKNITYDFIEDSESSYKSILNNFIIELEDIEKTIFKMYLKGMKLKEIAVKLNITSAAISYHMNRIKKKYKEFIKN